MLVTGGPSSRDPHPMHRRAIRSVLSKHNDMVLPLAPATPAWSRPVRPIRCANLQLAMAVMVLVVAVLVVIVAVLCGGGWSVVVVGGWPGGWLAGWVVVAVGGRVGGGRARDSVASPKRPPCHDEVARGGRKRAPRAAHRVRSSPGPRAPRLPPRNLLELALDVRAHRWLDKKAPSTP